MLDKDYYEMDSNERREYHAKEDADYDEMAQKVLSKSVQGNRVNRKIVYILTLLWEKICSKKKKK